VNVEPRSLGGGIARVVVAIALLTGCVITEPPAPEFVEGSFAGSVELTADRPYALIPITIRMTPGAAGGSLYAVASADTEPFDDDDRGVRVTAISDLRSQPRASLLASSVGLPAIATEEGRSPIRCEAPQTCDYPYRLLLALDEPADRTVNWKVEAGMSFPAGTDTTASGIELIPGGEASLIVEPPTVSESVVGSVTIGGAPQDRTVRLVYTGPPPSGWPLRVEAIVRGHRPDGERSPPTQLDLFDEIGPDGPDGQRIFAAYVGPDLEIAANLFDDCPANAACERFLVLHFYPASKPVQIDWEVEVRVRDFDGDGAVDAAVTVEEVAAQ
jgi:hypothetical protein